MLEARKLSLRRTLHLLKKESARLRWLALASSLCLLALPLSKISVRQLQPPGKQSTANWGFNNIGLLFWVNPVMRHMVVSKSSLFERPKEAEEDQAGQDCLLFQWSSSLESDEASV